MTKSKALIPQKNLDAIEALLARGDIAHMDQNQRLQYMKSMCKLLGISMLGQPFDFIKFQGKEGMYANAKCAAALRGTYKISMKIVNCERVDGLYVVTVEARTGKGREDADIGAINIKGLGGETLQNAMMKAVTKAKRRVTLSLCGLGSLDADTVRELAEMESKVATERAVEESEAKLELATERPEFEKEGHHRPSGPPEANSPHASKPSIDYVLKAGKIKGKTLKQVPVKKPEAWLTWFNEQQAAGKSLHPDIQDDAFHIIPFLEEFKILNDRLPLENTNG